MLAQALRNYSPSNFLYNCSGSVAPTFGLMCLPLMCALGTAVDYARITHAGQQLQQAADAAALAAGSASDKTNAQRTELAERIFAANNHLFAMPVVPSVEISGDSVSVTATTAVRPVVLQIFSVELVDISASASASASASVASAASAPSGQACLLALNSTDDWGINMGSSSGLVGNCGIYVNNTTGRAIKLGSGSMNSSFTAVVGTWETRGDFTYSPNPVRVSDAMADPLANLSAPSVGGCTYNSKRVRDGDPLILNPGVYCGGLEISTRNFVTFNPGVYVIKNGRFTMGSDSQAQGNGVFFYLTGSDSNINWGSGARMNFKAPSSGTWQGMLIWSAGAQSNPHVMGSHTTSVLQGAVYSPNTKVIIGCSGQVGASADWTVWVVRSLEVGSSATLKIMTNFAISATPLPQGLADAMTASKSEVRLTN